MAVNLSSKLSIYFRTQGWKYNSVATSIWKDQNADIPNKAYSTVARHSLKKKNTNSQIKKKNKTLWKANDFYVFLSLYFRISLPRYFQEAEDKLSYFAEF